MFDQKILGTLLFSIMEAILKRLKVNEIIIIRVVLRFTVLK